jgi:hypothetical protein
MKNQLLQHKIHTCLFLFFCIQHSSVLTMATWHFSPLRVRFDDFLTTEDFSLEDDSAAPSVQQTTVTKPQSTCINLERFMGKAPISELLNILRSRQITENPFTQQEETSLLAILNDKAQKAPLTNCLRFEFNPQKSNPGINLRFFIQRLFCNTAFEKIHIAITPEPVKTEQPQQQMTLKNFIGGCNFISLIETLKRNKVDREDTRRILSCLEKQPFTQTNISKTFLLQHCNLVVTIQLRKFRPPRIETSSYNTFEAEEGQTPIRITRIQEDDDDSFRLD